MYLETLMTPVSLYIKESIQIAKKPKEILLKNHKKKFMRRLMKPDVINLTFTFLDQFYFQNTYDIIICFFFFLQDLFVYEICTITIKVHIISLRIGIIINSNFKFGIYSKLLIISFLFFISHNIA